MSSIEINQNILIANGYDNLASKAVDNSISSEEFQEVYRVAQDEIKNLKKDLEGQAFDAFVTQETRDALLQLIQMIEANPPVAPVAQPETSEGAGDNIEESGDSGAYVWKPLDKKIPKEITLGNSVSNFNASVKEWMSSLTDSDISEQEKINSLLKSMGGRAQYTQALFGEYVRRGNGVYGDERDLFFNGAVQKDIVSLDKSDVEDAVGDASFAEMTETLNTLMAYASDPDELSTPMEPGIPKGSKEEQLKAISGHIDLLYAKTGSQIPGFNLKGLVELTNGTLNLAGNTALGVGGALWDVAWGVKYWLLGGAAWWKLTTYLPADSFPRKIPYFRGALGAPKQPSVPATGTSGQITEPKAPRRFASLGGTGMLDKLTPNSGFEAGTNTEGTHKEYYDKTKAAIQSTSTANGGLVSPTEVNRRIVELNKLSAQFGAGKLSREEFVSRAEAMEKGRGKIKVHTDAGKLDVKESTKRVVGKGINHVESMFKSPTRGMDAFTKAETKLRTSSFSGEVAGETYSFHNQVDQVDVDSFREMKEKLEKYKAMQEWGEYDRTQRIPLEQSITDKRTEIADKKSERSVKETTRNSTPPAISSFLGLKQETNPAYTALNDEIKTLTSEINALEAEERQLKSNLRQVQANYPTGYRPTGGTRAQFITDISGIKTEITTIHTALAGRGYTMPVFDPKIKVLDTGEFLKKVAKAIKK